MKRKAYLALSLGTAVLLTLLLVMAIGAQAPDQADGTVILVPVEYLTMQAAVDASANGDTIWVQEGLYDGGLFIDKSLTLMGGWNNDFTARSVPTNTTIINCDGVGRGISITTAVSDTLVTLDGFTIKQCNATGQGGSPLPTGSTEILHNKRKMDDMEIMTPAEDLTPAEHLAGLQLSLASVVERGLYPGGATAYQETVDRANGYFADLEETLPQSHSAAELSEGSTDCGGAIYSSNASLHLLNSIIEGNLASQTGSGLGGGVCINNSAPSGTRIVGNIFRGNIASAASYSPDVGMIYGYGGALYLAQAPGVVIEDNIIEENIASNGTAGPEAFAMGEGGGLYLYDSANVVLRGNKLMKNTASHGWYSYTGNGGGVFLHKADGSKVADNLFVENLAALNSMCVGGGLLVLRSDDVLIDGNEFSKNWACLVGKDLGNNGGGGVAIIKFETVTVTNNTLIQNITAVAGPNIGASVGGGLDIEDGRDALISDNIFQSNVACQEGVGNGGGMILWGVSDGLVANNYYGDNVGSLSAARGGGGGLLLRETQNFTVRSNQFQGNMSVAEGFGLGGGGVSISFDWFFIPSANITLEDNSFFDNKDSADSSRVSMGGGACFARSDGFTFSNNVAAGNTATVGSALFLGPIRNVNVNNNTLAGNSGDSAVFITPHSDPPIVLTNNIIVSHTVGISVAEGVVATASYTLWEGNGINIGGAGSITETYPVTGDPAFVDPSMDDYHLTIGSAAINAGDPAGVPPAPPTDLDSVVRPQGSAVDIGAYEWQGYWQHLPLVVNQWQPATGWAIGDDETGTAAIVHTADGGLTWAVQGDSTAWSGLSGNDISAVDDLTAWAALSSGPGEPDGVILHTTDGGANWVSQTIPDGLAGGIKGIKGLSRDEAWAASLGGKILHTIDGGATWNIVPNPTTPITQVNRIDAMGNDVWIADDSDTGAVVHTKDGGLTWRAEYLQRDDGLNDSPLTVHAFSPLAVWSSGSLLPHQNPSFYRTVDGGDHWDFVKQVGANDHLDDICAASPDDVWGAVNGNASTGIIWRVHVEPDGTPDAKNVTPPELGGFAAEGVTCLDTRVAWVAAQNERHFPGKPLGIILHTSDGGESWVQQSAPTDIEYWKISFVGARR